MVYKQDIRRISEKGWVVIPQDLREKYGLKAGTPVYFVDYGGVLSVIQVPEDSIKQGFGMFKDHRFTGRLLEERNRDKDRENEL